MKKFTKRQAQERVWQFIYGFRDAVTKDLAEKIDFIIIYGSAVRKEFVPGKSDVDIVIQVFREADKKMVEEKATERFWHVAKRYPELQFEKSLSVSQSKKRTPFTKMLEKLEQSSFLYVPVFVFAEGEIDWKTGTLHSDNPLIKLGQSLLIPQRSVFLRFKQEGEVLYGRDIRKVICIRLTIMDRLRLGAAPQLLSLISFFVSFIAPKKARGYAVKALLYQIDSLLTALSDYEKMERHEKIEKNERILLKEFTERLEKLVRLRLDYRKGALRPSDFRLFRQAIRIKWNELKLSRLQTIWFCLKANWFIVRSNARAIAYLFLRRIK
ncbi:nucleotidyltransferase domain-containing protein [Candidatus Peregrinibacteria bacterium]|nr:nucleotidyltransferase domain-containing protein [Candidatus Peregrinibacteria bacterium]